VMGAKNVIDAAIDQGVHRVVAISTDKACVDWHSRVLLTDGSTKAISSIVRQKLPVRVRSVQDGKLAEAEVTGWYKNKRAGRGMLRLSYEGASHHGQHEVGVWLTEDHPVLTALGWKKAGELEAEDELLVAEPWPNDRQFGFLVGTLLGDASLCKGASRHARFRLRFSQISTDVDWLRAKVQALRGFPHGKFGKERGRRGRTGQTLVNFRACLAFDRLAKDIYVCGRKAVPRGLVEQALRVAPAEFLAAWFLDDGCRVVNNPSPLSRSQVRFATHGFTESDVRWLAGCLVRHGFNCLVQRCVVAGRTYWELRLPTESAERLFSIIGPAVPPALRRKVTETAPAYDPAFWDLGEPTLSRAHPRWLYGTEPRPRDVYCLGVDQTQNFVVNGLVLHNCQPVNLYGATKLCAEKLVVQGNVYVGEGHTRFSVVRYGNVIGSRGSVVPLFAAQRQSGAVTVTDPAMTRFWIRLEDGVAFAIRCAELMHGGEIFVPKIPSMRVMDLVEAVAPGCRVEVIGIRSGEKLHEVLVSEDESRQARELDDMFVIEPVAPSWTFTGWQGSKRPAPGYHYSSATNTHWLSVDEMRAFVGS